MKKMSIIALLLIAVVVTGNSVSGTYAKYTSTFNGSTDTARVAKWGFTIDTSTAEPATNSFVFDLFNTINDSNGTAEETDVNNSASIIAPGTTGSFVIVLENKSEVNAQYTIDFEVENNITDEDHPIPVEFNVNDGEWTTSLADVAANIAMMNENNDDDKATYTINWRWLYTDNEDVDGRDAIDTALGMAAANGNVELSVSANITVTQAD